MVNTCITSADSTSVSFAINGKITGVTLKDISLIMSLRYAYNKLSAQAKLQVDTSTLGFLESAESALFRIIDETLAESKVATELKHHDVAKNFIDNAMLEYYMVEINTVYNASQIISRYSKIAANNNALSSLCSGSGSMYLAKAVLASSETAIASKLSLEGDAITLTQNTAAMYYVDRLEAYLVKNRIDNLGTFIDYNAGMSTANKPNTYLYNIGKIGYVYDLYTNISANAKSYLSSIYGSSYATTITNAMNKARSVAPSDDDAWYFVNNVVGGFDSDPYDSDPFDNLLNIQTARRAYNLLSSASKANISDAPLIAVESQLAIVFVNTYINSLPTSLSIHNGITYGSNPTSVALVSYIAMRFTAITMNAVANTINAKKADFKGLFGFDVKFYITSNQITVDIARLTVNALPKDVVGMYVNTNFVDVSEGILLSYYISAISSPVTLNDAGIIEYIEFLYATMSMGARSFVRNYSVFVSARSALNTIKANLSSRTNYSTVMSMISDIGEISALNFDTIMKVNSARIAYKCLDATPKSNVNNLAVLEEAESDLATLLYSSYSDLLGTSITTGQRTQLVTATMYRNMLNDEAIAYLDNAEALTNLKISLMDFIRNLAITTKSQFVIEGNPIRLNPSSIEIYNILEEKIANVTATHVYVRWSDFNSDNYQLSADSTGVTGATKLNAEVLPLPVLAQFGANNEGKIYDGKSLDLTFGIGEEERLYNKDQWSGFLSELYITVDDYGNTQSEFGELIRIPHTALIEGNFFVMSLEIVGYDYQGNFVLGIRDASNEQKHFITLRKDGNGNYRVAIVDEGNNENYVVTVPGRTTQAKLEEVYIAQYVDSNGITQDSQYEIKPRELKIDYKNSLQSWQDEPLAVSAKAYYDLINMGLLEEEKELSYEDFIALLKADKFINELGVTILGETCAIRVDNNWYSDNLNTYSKYIGVLNDAEANLAVYLTDEGELNGRNNNNYIINMPVLQVVYLSIYRDLEGYEDGDYVFKVETAQDVKEMGLDMEGLYNTRNDFENPEGKIPSFYQLENINMVDENGFVVTTSVGTLEGFYYGGGYTIYDYTVLSNSLYSGLFGRILGVFDETTGARLGGYVDNVNLVNAYIQASGGYYAGGIAGYSIGGEIVSSSVEGKISVLSASSAENILAVGGIVGYAEDTVITAVKFAGYINVTTNIQNDQVAYVGGIVGKYVLSDEQGLVTPMISEAVVFAASSVKTNGNSVLGGYVGSVEAGDEPLLRLIQQSSCSYLANFGIIHNVNTGVTIANSAFGDIASAMKGMTYTQMISSADANIVDTITLVHTYTMKNHYLGTGDYSLIDGKTGLELYGSDGYEINISNYKQLGIMTIYPWLSYQQTKSFNYPATIPLSAGKYLVYKYNTGGFAIISYGRSGTKVYAYCSESSIDGEVEVEGSI